MESVGRALHTQHFGRTNVGSFIVLVVTLCGCCGGGTRDGGQIFTEWGKFRYCNAATDSHENDKAAEENDAMKGGVRRGKAGKYHPASL